MSGQAVLDWSQLNDYTKTMLTELGDNLPKQYDSFLKSEARKINKNLKTIAESRITSRSGNYMSSLKVGKIYTYDGTKSIRVYSGRPAYHAHLIEYGHLIVREKISGTEAKKTERRNQLAQAGNKKTKAYNIFKDARAQALETFESDVSKFINRAIKKVTK